MPGHLVADHLIRCLEVDLNAYIYVPNLINMSVTPLNIHEE